jgi:hypothetical protein
VKVSHCSDETVRLGVAGPQAAVRVADALGLAVDTLSVAGSIASAGSVQVLCLGGMRFELVVPCAGSERLWGALAGTARPAGEPAWRWAAHSRCTPG